MARLRYTGTSDSYTLVAEDLKRHGVEGFSKTVWDASNGKVADVDDDAAAKILELMPKDFEDAGEGARSVDDDASSDEDDSESTAGKRSGRRNA